MVSERTPLPRDEAVPRAFFDSLWCHSSDSIFVVAPDATGELRIEAVNPNLERRSGRRAAELHGRPLRELLPPTRRAEVLTRYRECLERRAPLTFDDPGLDGSGHSHWHTLLIPVASDSGSVRIFALSRALTPAQQPQRRLRDERNHLRARHRRLLRANAQLRQLASIDHLTRSYNRRRFFELAGQAFRLARRQGHVLCALMVDIDLFKGVNDRFGHAIGDRTLEAVAAACRKGLRASDILGRYGGEEFAVLLPDTPLTDARQVAEKIRHNVEQSVVESDRGPVRATVSVGVAALTAEDEGIGALLERADRALFHAKRRGRNRVECHGRGAAR